MIMNRHRQPRPPIRRSWQRSLANSLLGSLLNKLAALGLLAILFGGFFLNERGVPLWMLIVAGAVAAFALILVEQRVFRSLAWRNPRRRT
jgi:hypothetical protein